MMSSAQASAEQSGGDEWLKKARKQVDKRIYRVEIWYVGGRPPTQAADEEVEAELKKGNMVWDNGAFVVETTDDGVYSLPQHAVTKIKFSLSQGEISNEETIPTSTPPRMVSPFKKEQEGQRNRSRLTMNPTLLRGRVHC